MIKIYKGIREKQLEYNYEDEVKKNILKELKDKYKVTV